MLENGIILPISLWQEAMPLEKAARHYCPADLKARLSETPPKGESELLMEFAQAFSLPINERLAEMKRHTDALSRANALMSEVYRAFWNLVQTGRLKCLAFEAPRRAADQPIHVPVALLQYYPDWKKGTYRHNGLHLIEMRVIEAEQTPVPETPDAPAPAGRPSFRADILEAFTALQAEGIFRAKPLTHGIVQIRQWIKTNRPDSRAAQGLLGDDTIRNAIKPHLGQDKVEKL